MKQGIIFGIVISIFSFAFVQYLMPNENSSALDIIIMQDGEEVFSTPLLYSDKVEQIWYVHEGNGNTKILRDEEIIDYYNFQLSVDDLLTPSNIDYNQIYEKSGKHTEINMIVNTGGVVRVIEANCPDKIDVKIGEISDPSKVITCAPHKLVIKLRSNGPAEDGEIDA